MFSCIDSLNATADWEELLDTFIGLNGIRVLSVIALLLVFSSNVVTLANDIKAVNRFMAGEKQTDGTTNSTISAVYDTDYIKCVATFNLPLSTASSLIQQGKHGAEPTCRGILGSLE